MNLIVIVIDHMDMDTATALLAPNFQLSNEQSTMSIESMDDGPWFFFGAFGFVFQNFFFFLTFGNLVTRISEWVSISSSPIYSVQNTNFYDIGLWRHF